MDIQSSKIELAKLILNIESPDLIIKIKNLLTKETGDFWLTLSDSEKRRNQIRDKSIRQRIKSIG